MVINLLSGLFDCSLLYCGLHLNLFSLYPTYARLFLECDEKA